jgi:hypothetical protein
MTEDEVNKMLELMEQAITVPIKHFNL